MLDSAYLNMPSKPCPAFVRGDKAMIGNPPTLQTCRDVQWKGGRWVYYWAKAADLSRSGRPGVKASIAETAK